MNFFLIVSVLCFATVFGSAPIPSDLPRCRAGDVICLQKVIGEIIHKYPKGYPAIFLPSLDPFHVNEMYIEQGADRPIAIKLNFTNLEFLGLSDAIISKVVGFEKNPKNSKFEVYARIPKLQILGDYTIDGKVLVLPIQGTGKSEIKMDDTDISAKFLPKVVVKNGKQYVQIEKFKLNFDTTKMNMHLTNLFNGDKALGDNMNIFLNENWKDIFDELKPSFSNAVLQILESIINRIFSKLSYDDIFIE